ncbi:MAG TPA: hypothetical protein VGP32_13290 [Steroidobacteraceae bacterium]|nr:hypothetical protein [Steroidobacteraceae bacterium]
MRRGEALAEVTATGVRTKFGRTAQLVSVARAPSTQEQAVLRVVRNLAIFSGSMVAVPATLCAIANTFGARDRALG